MSANKISPIFSGGARNILRINLVKTRREGIFIGAMRKIGAPL